MIGVAVRADEREIVREFFELFKTPWEFHQPGKPYDVVIGTDDQVQAGEILVLLFSGERDAFDARNRIAVSVSSEGTMMVCGDQCLPIYGKAATFPDNELAVLRDEATQAPMIFLKRADGRLVLRIGYDLFEEVRHLLTVGQPAANAGTATLEAHIAVLRELITQAGRPLVEIPPVPEGHSFIVCLTHDMDHPVLRNHCCDRTMFGFLYRATVGSFSQVLCGQRPVRNLWRNCAAVGRLPFVYLGMTKDPWRGFDRYLEIEAGLGSTYFVIPKRDYAGRPTNENSGAGRAARYEVKEIKPQLTRILAAGCEIGLHGLDAWCGRESGVEEREELDRALGNTNVGVRMHWLFFEEKSPMALDRAGFSYDSTVGYNETVGFRAGTAQAYQPAGTTALLELPLEVMDTALFYPNHLNLSETEAERLVSRVVETVERFGGALVINWHDRSIAPERLWEDFYCKMLGELRGRGAWFPTASQAVAWFRKRRSARFGAVKEENGSVSLSVSANDEPGLPGLRVRVHRPRVHSLPEAVPTKRSGGFVDVGFKNNVETKIAISA